MQPKVSVIIPCFNAEKYIEKAIASIINQTYTNLEILVVDDASTDKSLEKIKTFNDKRIVLIEMPVNTKKIGAVNKAISVASGEYIAFQDADDWSEPQRIEMQIEHLAKNSDCGLCFTNFDIRTEQNVIIPEKGKLRTTPEELMEEFTNFTKSENALLYKPTQCTTILGKSELFKAVGGYDAYFAGRVAEDVHMVYRMLKQTKAIALNKNLYHFIRATNSLTVNQFAGKNAKAAYSWPLLAKIIEHDKLGIDVLLPENETLLKQIELEACEESLVKLIQEKNTLQMAYELSTTFRVGRAILWPLRLIKKM